jgi:serine protease AprX
MKKLFICFWLVLPFVLQAQTAPDKYWIQFTDKKNSSFSVDHPEAFLSYRAIDRRARYQISIVENDLPVNQEYLAGLQDTGAEIIHRSKWFNGASVKVTDPEILELIRQLPYVANIKSVKVITASQKVEKFDELLQTPSGQSYGTDTSYYNYGYGSNQIAMVNGHILHNQGFRGQGMIIAILDGGFSQVDINPAFDSLWANHQILDTWDFVKGSELGFDAHTHGGHVLSVMGSNLPGVLVGTAPKASFMLFRTEDGGNEYRIEEDNWVAAAEYADSAGADLINNSLAYTRFDDPGMDYEYEDMDGNTTRITQAADIAASKGILVVASAANEGNKEWQYIGAPADGDSILTVGAVDPWGSYASFSSTGPTSDGRIKPNITAQGQETAIATTSGEVLFGNGTSFSSPLICGMAACLWQANKQRSNMDIINIIQNNSSQADNPDNLLGYGIPNFGKAYLTTIGIDSVNTSADSIIRAFPNPFTSFLSIDYYSPTPKDFELRIIDMNGRLAYRKQISPGFNNLTRIKLTDLEILRAGVYFIQISSGENSLLKGVVKQTL